MYAYMTMTVLLCISRSETGTSTIEKSPRERVNVTYVFLGNCRMLLLLATDYIDIFVHLI